MRKLLLIGLVALGVACQKDDFTEDTVSSITNNPKTFTEANVGKYKADIPNNHENYDADEEFFIEFTIANAFETLVGEVCRKSLFENWTVIENTPNRLRLEGGDIMIFTKSGRNVVLYYEDGYDGWNYTLTFKPTGTITCD